MTKRMRFIAGILCGSGSGLRHGALAARAHGQPEELHPAGERQEKKAESQGRIELASALCLGLVTVKTRPWSTAI